MKGCLRFAGAVALMVLGTALLTPQGTGEQSATGVHLAQWPFPKAV
jgi:hypothetical protein